MKIKELISTPLISNILHTSDYHFMDEYTNNSIALDNHYIKLYGGLQVDEELIGTTDTQTKTNITNEIRYYIIAHKEQLNRLYDINSLEYNPLYNVDGTTTTTYSEFEKEDSYGLHKTDNFYDENVTLEKKGAYTSIDTLGETETNTIDKTYGFNESSAVPNDEQKTTTNTVQNMRNIDPQENSVTLETRTDSVTSNAHTDTFTEKEHSVTEVRQGNIGITMSTQLIQSQFDVWSKIAFWDVLFANLFATITIPMYE